MWRQEVNTYRGAKDHSLQQPGAAFHVPRSVAATRSASAQGRTPPWAGAGGGDYGGRYTGGYSSAVGSANVSSVVAPVHGGSGHSDDQQSVPGAPYTRGAAYYNAAAAQQQQRGGFHQAHDDATSALVNSRSSSLRGGALPYGSISTMASSVPQPQQAPPQLNASIEVVARCQYLEAINADLRHEVDRMRTDCSRAQMENSRLKELLSTQAFQTDYLRLQLDKTASQNASMLSYENTAEGQTQMERLTHQNDALKQTAQEKDKQLAEVQLRLCELQGRVKGFEDALMQTGPNQSGGSKNAQQQERGPASAPAPRQLHVPLCEMLSSAQFITKSVSALHHLLVVRHSSETAPAAYAGSSQAPASCASSKVQCAHERFGQMLEGNMEPAAEMRARGVNKSDDEMTLLIQRSLLTCETLLVKAATHCLVSKRGVSVGQHEEQPVELAVHNNSNNRSSNISSNGQRAVRQHTAVAANAEDHSDAGPTHHHHHNQLHQPSASAPNNLAAHSYERNARLQPEHDVSRSTGSSKGNSADGIDGGQRGSARGPVSAYREDSHERPESPELAPPPAQPPTDVATPKLHSKSDEILDQKNPQGKNTYRPALKTLPPRVVPSGIAKRATADDAAGASAPAVAAPAGASGAAGSPKPTIASRRSNRSEDENCEVQ